MAPWQTLIDQIHAAARPAVIAVTGGGASVIGELLSVPGGSKSLLDAVVPYSAAALAEWLGRRPEHFCSEATALTMAAAAHQRAEHLAQAEGVAEGEPLGVACTSSLVSNVPKRGPHRVHVATHSAAATESFFLNLDKDVRDRRAEESLAGRLILSALARAAGLNDVPPLDLRPGETILVESARAEPLLAELVTGRRGVVWSISGRELAAAPPQMPRGLLCGAFAPLHAGHVQLRTLAAQILGGVVGFELLVHNVDKPPLDYLTIARRRAQFTEHPLALTNAPTFAAKSQVLPGMVFVVGVDTADRIVQPRYYGGSEAQMHAALAQIRTAGCRFLVAGRLVGDRFTELGDLDIPQEFTDLFDKIPASVFRVDISSTELRAASHS